MYLFVPTLRRKLLLSVSQNNSIQILFWWIKLDECWISFLSNNHLPFLIVIWSFLNWPRIWLSLRRLKGWHLVLNYLNADRSHYILRFVQTRDVRPEIIFLSICFYVAWAGGFGVVSDSLYPFEHKPLVGVVNKILVFEIVSAYILVIQVNRILIHFISIVRMILNGQMRVFLHLQSKTLVIR